MARPRVVSYDELHAYLEDKYQDEQAAVSEYSDADGNHDLASLHAARGEAFREVVDYIEFKLGESR